MRTYKEATELARLCANQARITTVKTLADEMWRLALEYQQEAAELDPKIRERPAKLSTERQRRAA
jgi:hypothetical protein